MKSILIFAAVVLCATAAPTDPTSALVETINSGFDDQGHELYQGDMVLTEYQKEHLLVNKSTIDKRKAYSDIYYRWPKATVSYKISASSEPDRAVIERAIQQWRDNTCIQFNNVLKYFKRPHVTFEELEGCWSHLGYQNQVSGQTISVGPTCKKMGTIAHEIGHALGFYHEQNRPDRDSSVVVLEDNIKAGYAYAFAVETNINYYSLPYDVGSIMHYASNFFGIGGKNTLVTKNVWDHFRIGQRDGLSFWDIKLANLMYNCGGKCKSPPTCTNGGFVDKNCVCVCPPGFTGETCQDGSEDIPISWTCGEDIRTSPFIIRSPNYPEDYPAKTKCIWSIWAPKNKIVSAQFNHFELHRANDTDGSLQCKVDVFELRSLADIYEGNKYCGNQLHGQTKISATHRMDIVFYASSPHKGFEINITFVPAPSVI